MKNDGDDENEIIIIEISDSHKNYIYPNKLKLFIIQYQAYTFN